MHEPSVSALTAAASRPLPGDQAQGLRRLFRGHRVRWVPVVANPHLAVGGLLLERLCAAFSAHGANTLVVDAAETAQAAEASALARLSRLIEPLSHQVSYLAVRGLPARCVDADGFTSALLDAVGDAAAGVDVVLVHAPAAELARLFSRHDARHAGRGDITPLLLCDDHPASVTHAYAGLKVLALRAGRGVHDVLLAAAPDSPRAPRIADQLAACAELYLQATVRHALRVDPAGDAFDTVAPEMQRWAQQWLGPGGSPHLTAPHAAHGAKHALN